jgi:hypothetical protein
MLQMKFVRTSINPGLLKRNRLGKRTRFFHSLSDHERLVSNYAGATEKTLRHQIPAKTCLPRYCRRRAQPAPDRFAKSLNRDGHHSDQLATVYKRRDSFAGLLTDRLRPHGKAGSQNKKENKSNVCLCRTACRID